jgi:uncharacterized YccA/Bax inhibitor family protein
MEMKSGNPALSPKTFEGLEAAADPMTLPGTINRTAMLLAIVMIGAAWTWSTYYASRSEDAILPYLLGGAVGGLVVAMATIFFKKAAPYTSPVYALLEGFVLGGLSALYENQYPGIAVQSVGLTFGTLVCMLVLYKTGVIRATEKFKLGVVAATGGICVLYLVDLALMFFGKPIAFIHEGGVWGIAFSLFVVLIAALNLIMDFDFIEQGVASRSPKYMEWYAAFGLMVTLIWLYLEIIRLLSKLRDRR